MKKRAFASAAALALTLGMAGHATAGGIVIGDDGTSKLKAEAEVYTDISNHKATASNGTVTKTNAATVSRAYLTLKYTFDDNWMMRVTTDVSGQSNLNSKNNNIFLKYAYLQGKLMGDQVVLRLGQSHTPWIDHEEHLWAHRYASPVLIDHNGYDASSDLGIGLKGKLAGGLFNYFATITNGAGYSHPLVNNTKGTGSAKTRNNAMDFDGVIGSEPIKGLTLDVQYRNGYKGLDKNLAGTAQKTLVQGMVTYGMGKTFRVGLNYAKEKSHFRNAATADTNQRAYALWGWGKFSDNAGAFGRYEQTDFGAAVSKQKRFLVGVEYFPIKHVILAFVFDKTTSLKGAVNAKDQKFGLNSEFKY